MERLFVIFFFGETNKISKNPGGFFQGFSPPNHGSTSQSTNKSLRFVRNESFDEQLKYSLLRLKLVLSFDLIHGRVCCVDPTFWECFESFFLLKIGVKMAEINTSEKTCRVKNKHEVFTEVYCGN